jgi:hypothetical protein
VREQVVVGEVGREGGDVEGGVAGAEASRRALGWTLDTARTVHITLRPPTWAAAKHQGTPRWVHRKPTSVRGSIDGERLHCKEAISGINLAECGAF